MGIIIFLIRPRIMPTSYKDQFYLIDPGGPPLPGTAVTFERYEFVDEDDSGFIETGGVDTINGSVITQVWQGDTLTINVPGVGDVTYVGVTFYTESGVVYFTPTDMQVLQDGTFVSSTYVEIATETSTGSFGPTCFTPGTLIETPSGPRPIDDLRSGDMVMTRDSGAQRLAAVISREYDAVGPAAPVLIRKGALGNRRDLLVSQQHRILLTDSRAELWFGLGEVLVAAVHLVDGREIVLRPGGRITYIHLVFERHEIVVAEGLPAESYCPANVQRPAAPACGQLAVLADLFLDGPGGVAPARVVRPVLRGHEARVLVH